MKNGIYKVQAVSRMRSKVFVVGMLLGALSMVGSLWHLEVGLLPAAQASAAESALGDVMQPLAALAQRVQLKDGRWLQLNAAGTQLRKEGAGATPSDKALDLPEVRINPSLTLLPSGRVLIWGGTDGHGTLRRDGLWYDPTLDALSVANDLTLSPRAGHTATVLTDGSVLFAGGDTASAGMPAELWDERRNRALALADETSIARRGHTALLQSDGQVRIAGGVDRHGTRQETDLVYSQNGGRFSNALSQQDHLPAGLAGSIPAQGAKDVLPSQRLSVRFAQPVNMADFSTSSVTLIGPGGTTPIEVMPAEGGRLLFVSPKRSLFPASHYTLMVDGVRTREGKPQPLVAIDFSTAALDAAGSATETADTATEPESERVTTGDARHRSGCDQTGSAAQPCRAHGFVDNGIWYPGRDNTDSRWRIYSDEKRVELAGYSAIMAARYKLTALRGRVVRVDQMPVANVEVSIGSITTRTNADGWFALFDLPQGHQELYVDGSTANVGADQYGQFVVGVDIKPGRLNELPYLMHLPKISARDKVRIASPLKQDLVIGHPDIPGLELHIPKGTVIHDRKGRLVNEIAIVPTPVNRAPFPVMENHPMAFTVEPGASQVRGLDPDARNGIRVYYPNYDNYRKGTEADFWIYDPTDGWRVYGRGTVSKDGRHFVPEQGVALHETMGGMYSVPGGNGASEPNLAADNSGQCGCSGDAAVAGDPVDLKTGEFTHAETDLSIDDIVPITVGRNYRPNDLKRGVFGIGMSWNWGYTLNRPSTANYDVLELVQPNGSSLRFDRISGTGNQGEWRQAGSNTRFAGALIKTVYDSDPTQPWGRAFLLTLRDGSRMQFSSWNDIRVRWIEDRHGNRTSLLYNAGLISEIISPSGRSVAIAYDGSNRIKTLRDHTGREWSYSYDSNGLLSKATYPDATFRQYTFQTRVQNGAMAQHRIESITNQRGHRLLLNRFETVNGVSTGRVIKQTQADGGEISIDYAHVDNGVTGTLVTEVDGSKRRIVFADGTPYPVSETLAYGTAEAQTFTYERNSNGQLIRSTDPLGRKTEYSYNADGQTTQIIAMAGTAKARTLSMTYNADGDLTSITDPLNRVTRLGYQNRCLSSVTDTLNRTALYRCNAAGQMISATDPLQRTLQLHYDGFDLVGVTDTLGRRTNYRIDSLGRVVATEDPQGNVVRREYDVMGRVKKLVDAHGMALEYGFDANGNVAAVLLPNGNGITYTYDSRDRPLTRTDATGKGEQWTYDLADRVTSHIDRLQRAVVNTYDVLGRPKTTTFQDGTKATYTYDAGNRLRALTDTGAVGTLSWDYDDFDAVIAESGPQGTVGYAYDGVGRRKEMRAGAQAQVIYTYDDGDRLRQLDQGMERVQFDYDDVDRLGTLTLPNGVEAVHGYDEGNQLTSLAWQKPSKPAIGTLSFDYDRNGQVVSQSGSFASQVLPAATTSTSSFDDANRQLTHNGRTLTYDDNGNLIGDGVRSYVWNVRNQLVEIREGTSTIAAFGYDPLGRRVARTEGGVATQYLYDGQNAVQEAVGNNANPILTGLGVDQRFARNGAGGRTYYLTDHLGSTRGLTNASGDLLERYDYTPYGQLQNAPSGSTNPYRYTGREEDESGLYYYRARYYSPEMGRFISEDSYGFASGDANFYAYALGNPISYNDPSGHIAWFVLVPLIWGGIEVAISLYDAYDTGRTLLDPCETTEAKVIAAVGFGVGLFAPGGGYGSGSKKVYQYALRAKADGWYPVMTRGSKSPTSQVWLSEGEVWKFGTTQNPNKRYPKQYLQGIGTGGVDMVKEFDGTRSQALMLEQMKIDNFHFQNGQLPPGNKVRR
ncbi:RHS Repeat protein [Xanthomonas sp. SS]|uniref:RHS repeat-associated core domain-containing protein n=1 Tax=Xanthomonas sp. SS TaxID=2724122 RepID=UPI00163A5284|nr:RHS repeat-associated core domain-containing protein [Xanthomonas sp. SS]QNH16232.1 RHS Repeat protein [Xanthomonas sp. SS]